jgi:hypothetical protein
VYYHLNPQEEDDISVSGEYQCQRYDSLEKKLKMRPKKLRRALDKLSPVTHQATMSSSVLRSADGESIVQVGQ